MNLILKKRLHYIGVLKEVFIKLNVILKGNTKILKLLLAEGADANSESTFSKTPLYYALRNNSLESVR